MVLGSGVGHQEWKLREVDRPTLAIRVGEEIVDQGSARLALLEGHGRRDLPTGSADARVLPGLVPGDV